ncbi:uncharacterized protein LOC108672922 [Hyalella azteca]|uniref:Uncharacterized protein LOC108672922 n=1 Tax=Hyalella azteca TaxID=294128 RepID=A0A8B7NR48_HYAAZ|nr:uncharacterized protein LOC108672922 [Hyalella azteca]
MAHRSRRRLYETAFDSKVEKPLEEGSSDLLDRIANHPILLLLNPRRRSRQSNNNSSKQKTPHDKNLNIETSDQPSSVHYAYHHDNPILLRSPCPTTVLPKAKFQGSGTPRCGRRGARARVCPPPRSLSSHHLLNSSLRPIGLSKSDDQILNRVSDSPDDEDCFEDYVEGRQAEDLARDLITLHLNADENNRRSSEGSAHSCHVESACGRDSRLQRKVVECLPNQPRRFMSRKGVAERGLSVDSRINDATCSWDCLNDNCHHHHDHHNLSKYNQNDVASPRGASSIRSSSILALHHPNVSSPRMQHHDRLLHGSGSSSSSSLHHSPLLQHASSASPSPKIFHVRSETSSPRQLSYSASPSPKLSTHSSCASPNIRHSFNTPSPRLLKSRNTRAPQTALLSPRLLHLTASANTDAYNLTMCSSARSTLSTSAAIARVLQGPADCSSAPTIASPASYSQGKSKLSIDEPSASGYSSSRVSPSGKSSLRDLKRSEGLAKLKPLELHSPPGTAPLPVKFIKKPPLSDRSPSSWFSPPRQKDLSLPIKRSSQSRSSSSDASSSDRAPYKSRVKKSSSSTRCEGEKRPTTTPSSARALATNSETSINSSMEVLVDTASESGISMPPHAGAKTSSLSLDSIASGTSSMESLKSSVSEGAGAVGWRNMGSNSSLPLRPSLLLPATHRSLIQSAKFQILSPISDKSQEPSSTDTGGPIVGGMGIVGGGSQHTSPQDLLQQTPLKCRNISEDFRNIHHIIPGPLSGNKGHVGESDSGISIEYGHQSSGSNVLKDLPFDMPKLRRRLAAAHSCPSNSDSSLASCGSSLQQQQQLQQQTPAGLVSVCNPAISRVQACEVQSGTSSSNSSLWEAGSSASSSIEGTPRKAVLSARGSLVLDLGGFNKLVAPTGEEVDVSVPLTKQSWYHGKINKGEAEKLLRCETEGAYLVRSIDTPRWEYSLALKAASGFMHLKIQYHSEANGFKMGRGDQLFPSVPHIVHHHSIHKLPVKGAENMFLVKPIISETL